MIVLDRIVLVAALEPMGKSRQRELGSRSWGWFAGRVAAGAFFVSSLLAGYSIGQLALFLV